MTGKNKNKRTRSTFHVLPACADRRFRRGFTLLFASLVGALTLTIGLSIFNIILKELVLSSTISESQEAFAAADSGTECALFWDTEHPGFENSVFGGDPQNLVPNGLVGYWDLDEGSGSTAFDSALSNDGSISGAAWITGKVGGALSFNGSSDSVIISDNNSLFADNKVSIAAWVWRNNENATHVIYSDFVAGQSPDTEYSLELLPSTSAEDVVFYSNDGATDSNVSAQGLLGNYPTNEWVHITATWDGLSVRFYLDGLLKDTVSFNHNPTEKIGTNPRIGRRSGGANPMDGRLDEVRVYGRVLSKSEIELLAEQSEAQPFAPVPQNSGLSCNGADITNPATGWDSSSGWDVTDVTETTAKTVFDIAFSDNTCATVTVNKDGATTTIDSRGYNTCNLSNPRRVERGLRVTY